MPGKKLRMSQQEFHDKRDTVRGRGPFTKPEMTLHNGYVENLSPAERNIFLKKTQAVLEILLLSIDIPTRVTDDSPRTKIAHMAYAELISKMKELSHTAKEATKLNTAVQIATIKACISFFRDLIKSDMGSNLSDQAVLEHLQQIENALNNATLDKDNARAQALEIIFTNYQDQDILGE